MQLTHDDVETLREFLEVSGALTGLNAIQAHSVCRTLFNLVEGIAWRREKRVEEELKAVAVQAAFDALDAQREGTFEGLRRMAAWPQ